METSTVTASESVSQVVDKVPELPLAEEGKEVDLHKGNRGAIPGLAVSARAHENIKAILKRQGLANIDPRTEEGQLISGLMQEIFSASNTKIPEIVKIMAAEAIVEAILMRRSLVTHVLQVKKPDQTDTDRGKARRQALQIALGGIAKMNTTVLQYIKVLGLDATTINSDKRLSDILSDLEDRK